MCLLDCQRVDERHRFACHQDLFLQYPTSGTIHVKYPHFRSGLTDAALEQTRRLSKQSVENVPSHILRFSFSFPQSSILLYYPSTSSKFITATCKLGKANYNNRVSPRWNIGHKSFFIWDPIHMDFRNERCESSRQAINMIQTCNLVLRPEATS